MDIRGCVLVVLLLVNSLFVAYISAAQLPRDGLQPDFPVGEVDSPMNARLSFIEKKLREDIERELRDVIALEGQLHNNIQTIQEKKRQLEIKKRSPVRCLVNIVACWKK